MATADDPILLNLDNVDKLLIDRLHGLGEHFAAGFLELKGAAPLGRMARAIRRQLEYADVPLWSGETLYPAGHFSWYRPVCSVPSPVVSFSYSHSLRVNREVLEKRCGKGTEESRTTYTALAAALRDYPEAGQPIDLDISLGGRNYTHSILNYGRVVREGLRGYARRSDEGLARADECRESGLQAFYQALNDVMQGIRTAHARLLAALEQAVPKDEGDLRVWERLVSALEHVPWESARGFYEALVAANFMYYIDGTDSLGRFDQDLGDFYEAELDAGHLTHEEGVGLVGQMWDNVNANNGWNVAIGGTRADGSLAANRLTLACLVAARGRRRPNLALRLSHEMPEEFLDAALDALATGCGIPALYNEELYLHAIRKAHLNMAPQDIVHFAFGGCTELMVHGRSNVGSLDAGLNLPLIMMGSLREHLVKARDFESLWQAFAQDLRLTIARLARQVSAAQEEHARYQPQPIRSLFIDDCLLAGVEYNAGGARYNWSVINVGGLGNVVDSLVAVQDLLYERGEVDAATLWTALEADYEGYETLRLRLVRCAHYGNDDSSADLLAQRIARLVFEELGHYAPWRGGRFLGSCLMFATYAGAGEPVMATPDGRRAGEPIADSIGAVQGRDRSGPTALIRSVASIPQCLAPGTLVTNFRFARSVFEGENRAKLKDLIRVYFRLGGLQMQITVVDQETLRKAIAAPDAYGDLIVRIGGYSEYWRNLSESLRWSVLERTEHVL